MQSYDITPVISFWLIDTTHFTFKKKLQIKTAVEFAFLLKKVQFYRQNLIFCVILTS